MDDEQNQDAPVVFISYSHDSEEHRTWVRKLATALRALRVDVLLDQWELGPGDDLPKFMEQSVKKAIRVIMVCTEPYVRKANDGKGGAGYEVMVVTSELVENLGTRKFIPLIRQSGDSRTLPTCVSTRYFVNFNKDEEFDEKIEEVARSIHEAPAIQKPTLGKNPFKGETPQPATPAKILELPTVPSVPGETYIKSKELADQSDFSKWRALVHQIKKSSAENLVEWRRENEKNIPQFKKDLPGYFLSGVSTHATLFAAAFGALDSADAKFHNQLSLIDDVRIPKGWDQGGLTIMTNVPDLVVFTYQALFGALAINRRNADVAYNLATTRVKDPYSQNSEPLFKAHWAMGWPVSMDGDCTVGWSFLKLIIHEWKWIWELFGGEDAALASLIAYYSFLNTIDFVSATKAQLPESMEMRDPIVPLNFVFESQEVLRMAGGIVQDCADHIGALFEENNIGAAALAPLWDKWMRSSGKWVREAFRGRMMGLPLEGKIPHWDLPRHIRGPHQRRAID